MSPRRFLRAIKKAGLDIDRKHLLAFSSSLAYYYFLSLLPLLILIASALAYIPIPHLFDQVLLWMAYFVPADSMTLVKKVFSDLMATRNSGFLSFGIVGTIGTASGASAAMIEALNVAYDVKEGRPFWHMRHHHDNQANTETARQNQRVGGQNKGSSTLPEADRLDVRFAIASTAGVSVGNVSKVKQWQALAHLVGISSDLQIQAL